MNTVFESETRKDESSPET